MFLSISITETFRLLFDHQDTLKIYLYSVTLNILTFFFYKKINILILRNDNIRYSIKMCCTVGPIYVIIFFSYKYSIFVCINIFMFFFKLTLHRVFYIINNGNYENDC